MKRWLQPDTVDLLRYTYTSGDPVSFVDPSGREPVAPVPSAADWSHAAERPPSWVAFRGDGVEPGTVEGDPNCKSGPGGPECKLPPVDVPWPGKSPQQLKDEAERDLREFLGAATSVRADNARMAALASSVDRPNRPGYWRRVWRNIVLTNKVVPGMLVPPFTAGVLFWAFKVPADALVWGGVSPVAWALSGFRGATIGAATFTGLETGAIAGATAATNWALVGIAFEIGVGIGSMIQAAVED